MRYKILAGVAAVVIFLDQLTKYLVVQKVSQQETITVLDGFFNIIHIYNRGAAFGFLNRSDIEWQFWLFLVATCIAVVAIYYLVRTAEYCVLLFTALGLVLGGALGNLIDRIRFRAVVDFLDFYAGSWHWPAFNVADIAICLGAMLTIVSMYMMERKKKMIQGME